MSFTALRFENEIVTVATLKHKNLVFSCEKYTVIPVGEFKKERFWSPLKTRILYIPRHTNEDIVSLPREITDNRRIHSLLFNRFRRDHTKKITYKVVPSINKGKTKKHYSYIGIDALEIKEVISHFADDVRLSFLTVPHFALARLFAKIVHGKVVMGVYADATFLNFVVTHEGGLRFSKQYNFKEKGLYEEDRETFMANKCRLAYRLFCEETGIVPDCTVLALEERDAVIVSATLHDEGAILASVNPLVTAPTMAFETFYSLFPLMGLAFIKESESFLTPTVKWRRLANNLFKNSFQTLSLAILLLLGITGINIWFVIAQNEALKDGMKEFQRDLADNSKNILSPSYLNFYLHYTEMKKEIRTHEFIPFFNKVFPVLEGHKPVRIVFEDTKNETVLAITFYQISSFKTASREIFARHNEALTKASISIQTKEDSGTVTYRFSRPKKGKQ